MDRRVAVVVALSLGSCAISSALSAPPNPATQAQFARLLAGRVPGRPMSCIPSYPSAQTEVISADTIAIRQGSMVYLSQFRGTCNQAGSPGYALVFRNVGMSARARMTWSRSKISLAALAQEVVPGAIRPVKSRALAFVEIVEAFAVSGRDHMPRIFSDGVSCSFSIVKGSSATMNLRTLSTTDRSAFTAQLRAAAVRECPVTSDLRIRHEQSHEVGRRSP